MAQIGYYLGTRNITEVDSTVPTLGTQGWDLRLPNLNGGEVRDGIAFGALFDGGTTPSIEVIPYLWFPVPGVWLPGAKITLYPHAGVTADAGGLSVPQAVGGATRLYLFVVGYSGAATSADVYAFGCEQVRR